MLKERKITKIGNSFGITLPQELLEKLGLKNGDEVYIENRGKEIVIKKKIPLPKNISEDFFEILQSSMDEYDETIKALRDDVSSFENE